MAKKERKYVIGVDEAGYGPNLGPLAIGASVWQVPSDIDLNAFADQLEPHFQPKRLQAKEREPFVPLGDSKELYQSGVSTESLQIGVLSLMQNSRNLTVGAKATLWNELLEHCDCLRLQPVDHKEQLPWYSEFCRERDLAWLPAAPSFASIAKRGLEKLDTVFEGFQARLVDEIVFNQGLQRHGSKGKLLSLTTLQLVKDCVERLSLSEVASIEIYCDRHGGRSKYLELLHAVFEDVFFWIESETAHESRYRTEWNGCPLRIRFTVGGDRFPPTSAASMIAKWLREASMDCFNAYWRSKVADLKPTAGYPVDANRFIEELKSGKIWETDKGVPQLETIWRRA